MVLVEMTEWWRSQCVFEQHHDELAMGSSRATATHYMVIRERLYHPM